MSFSQTRLERLSEALREDGADGMYVRDTPNIEWLTGFENVFDDERAHAMLVLADGSAALHTDSRYITAMQREAEDTPIEVDAEVARMSEWLAAKCKAAGYGGDAAAGSASGDAAAGLNMAAAPSGESMRLFIEDTLELREFRALEKALGGDPFVETDGLILGLRSVKDADEVARMRSAQAVTDAAFDHICGFIRPGMTEREVQLELDGFMLRNGASGLAFPSIVASGANGASPHAIVSDKPLEAGECIVMDFGAKRFGYCSDMTRTVFLGAPKGEMLRAWETLRRANEAVEAMLRPGITGIEAHMMAERVLAEGGFEGRMGHGLGHGVGIQVHELPNLNTRNDRPLVAGNVVTVEPGIYIPGAFGMRLEDYGIVTEHGFDVFTRSTHDLVVL